MAARTIPVFDSCRQHHTLKTEIHEAIERVFSTGNFILGDEVAAFEEEVAAFVGTRYAVACACGTDALHLAIRAAGIGEGDEVITSAFSFVATAEAILHAGATPVFADVNPETFTLDPAAVEAALSPKVKAILPVHLYGHPADMNALQAIAERHALIIIEDCAQAFGARYGSNRVGSLSLAGCHSFFPTKNLGGGGDGGGVTTDDRNIAQRIRRLRNHGCDGAVARHKTVGYNSRLDEIQAAILRVKLRYLEEFNRKRRQLAAAYTAILQGHLQTPYSTAGCKHAFNQYTVLCRQRDIVAAALDEAKISSRIYYPLPLPEQPSLRNKCRSNGHGETTRITRECLSLPMFPELSPEDVRHVAGTIVRALG